MLCYSGGDKRTLRVTLGDGEVNRLTPIHRLMQVGKALGNRLRRRPLQHHFYSLTTTLALAAWLGGVSSANAVLQFDVFLGYDGIVPEASWFPVVCEIKNDGPSFTGIVEVGAGNFNQSQTRREVVELPTGTLKRIVIPAFSSTRAYSTWNVQLLDERGKVRSEQIGLRPRRQIAAETLLMGALPRTASGAPVIRPIASSQSELQPMAARMLPSIFPDNPLVLEGMNSIYLNSEKASELSANQVEALLGWLNSGGHLIVAVEQITDVNSTAWLMNLFPCELRGMLTLSRHPELQEWLKSANWGSRLTPSPNAPPVVNYGAGRNRSTPRTAPPEAERPFGDLPDDFAFDAAELQIATGIIRDGAVQVASQEHPLVVTATRGRGRITALLFSPEREPLRSWKNLPTFWAKICEVPGLLYVSSDFNRMGGWSSDGIFGAMLDSRQVHKLPVEWLLVLLIVYLIVIGPLDQYWLKRIGRPMLTWITFPCYVVLFSFMIYFIGYKLRAGESEWNELHLVDVLLKGEHVELRGRTYASIYSPVNQRYNLESQQKFATLRSEFAGNWSGGQSAEKASVLQTGDAFKAEIFVPVWTSQLFVSDWWQSANLPISVSIESAGDAWKVQLENHTDRKITSLQLVVGIYIMPLGDVDAKSVATKVVSRKDGLNLKDFVVRFGASFQNVVQSRQHAFGAAESGRLDDLVNCSVAASFLSELASQQNYMNFLAPPGLDLTPLLDQDQAVVLAWAADYSPAKPMNQFTPRRSHRDTLWRIATRVKSPKPASSRQPEA